jgi:prophage antirepressor-like protein
MTNQLTVKPFTFHTATIRTVVVGDEPRFVARDVAMALGYAVPPNAVARFCKAAQTCVLETGTQGRNMTIIPERDVYRLVMNSKLPAAEEFEEWVVSEVLPSIRKTGSYVTGQPSVQGSSNLDIIAHQLKLLTAMYEEAQQVQARMSVMEQCSDALLSGNNTHCNNHTRL